MATDVTPDIYQTHPATTYSTYGGFKGDLWLFLALIAFSMSQKNLRQYLLLMSLEGLWQIHGLPRGLKYIVTHISSPWVLIHVQGTRQRGVVVHVYACPGTTMEELRQYENGAYGKYYN